MARKRATPKRKTAAKKYAPGARKAYAAMVKKYGKAKGTAIYYAKANRFKAKGPAKAPKTKANSTYKKGTRLGKPKTSGRGRAHVPRRVK